jgi:hypothetical protein
MGVEGTKPHTLRKIFLNDFLLEPGRDAANAPGPN